MIPVARHSLKNTFFCRAAFILALAPFSFAVCRLRGQKGFGIQRV
jgi:hypothetical protein